MPQPLRTLPKQMLKHTESYPGLWDPKTGKDEEVSVGPYQQLAKTDDINPLSPPFWLFCFVCLLVCYKASSHFGTQADLELILNWPHNNPPDSASRVLRQQGHTPHSVSGLCNTKGETPGFVHTRHSTSRALRRSLLVVLQSRNSTFPVMPTHGGSESSLAWAKVMAGCSPTRFICVSPMCLTPSRYLSK